MSTAQAPGPGEKGSQSLFEESDFDEILQATELPAGRNADLNGSGDKPVAVPLPEAWGTHGEPPYDVEKLPLSPHANFPTGAPIARPNGLVLTKRQLILIALLGILVAVILFGVGLWCGYFLGRASTGGLE